VTVSFATHQSTEEVAKALAAASGGVAFAAERGWVVRNDEGKELTVRVDAGVATASLGGDAISAPVVSRAVVEAVPETPGCVAVMHLETPETGAMDLAIHLPFAAHTPTSFAIASPKLTDVSGVAPHPQLPAPVLTQVSPAAVLVVGVGLDGVNFSRFLHGKDLRKARHLQRWFPVTSGTTLALTVESAAGGRREVMVKPEPANGEYVADRDLVFEPIYKTMKAGSIAGALRRGLLKTKEDLSMVYGFLGKLTRQQISPRLLGGPIEIAKQAGRSASEGFGRLLLFLTMLSANLAVVNFLPIPVLDGGHMVFLAYEWIRGKPPSEGVVVVLSYLGLALILSLMFFVFGLDLGLIPRR
jgi:membrane-associated protease RseP (regulator of RpoE activity)